MDKTPIVNYDDYQTALRFDAIASGIEVLKHLTQIFIDELDPRDDDRVLDVGTGTGRLGTELLGMVPGGFVAGIDSAYAMLQVAQDKLPKKGLDNYFVVQGRSENLPFISQSFNSACLMLSLHHFSDPEKALGEVYRTLKARGYLVSLDPVLKDATDDEGMKLNAAIEESFQMAHGHDFRFFTARELTSLYEGVGFNVESSEIYDYPFEHARLQVIPMASHWLQTHELLIDKGDQNLVDRFEKDYFSFRQSGKHILVKGKMSWAVTRAARD